MKKIFSTIGNESETTVPISWTFRETQEGNLVNGNSLEFPSNPKFSCHQERPNKVLHVLKKVSILVECWITHVKDLKFWNYCSSTWENYITFFLFDFVEEAYPIPRHESMTTSRCLFWSICLEKPPKLMLIQHIWLAKSDQNLSQALFYKVKAIQMLIKPNNIFWTWMTELLFWGKW